MKLLSLISQNARSLQAHEVMKSLRNCALSGDQDRLQDFVQERVNEHIDYVEDVAKLVKHVAWTDSAQVRAKHAQINLHIYGPQMGVAATSVCYDPRSPVAKDNLEAFCQMWQHLVDDVIQISKQVADQTNVHHLRTDPAGAPDGGMPPPPRIMKQPPTPTGGPPSSPYMGPGGNYGFRSDETIGGYQGNTMGKFHKSVPDLNSVLHGGGGVQGVHGNPNMVPPIRGAPAPSPGHGAYLDPNKDPRVMEGPHAHHPMTNGVDMRRHSTSGIPPHNPWGYGGQGHYGGGGVHDYPNPMPPRSDPERILASYSEVENNEIIKRAKRMASHAVDIFEFTRGYGKVKTTQDLFNSAEAFSEETNVIYKVIRIFSYDVPSGEDKRVLMAIADNIPKHCHQLQMLIQVCLAMTLFITIISRLF